MEEIKEFDGKGNLIYRKDNSNGYEEWRFYDENGNLIHFKNSNGLEVWRAYDKNGNIIHSKDSNGFEIWYDEYGNIIDGKYSNLTHKK